MFLSLLFNFAGSSTTILTFEALYFIFISIMRCSPALWVTNLLVIQLTSAHPTSENSTDSNLTATNSTAIYSTTTAFNSTISSTHTSNLNATISTHNKPTYTPVSKTISELPNSYKETSMSTTAYLPTPTASTTSRFNTTSIHQNSSLTQVITDILNGTHKEGFGGTGYAKGNNLTGVSLASSNTSNTLAVAEAFVSDMFRFADRQNMSDAQWTSMICSPSAFEDARKRLAPIDLAALEQTCAIASSNRANNTLNDFTNLTGIRPYNISEFSPESSLRRLSKAAPFALPQFGRGCMDDFGYFEMTAANLEESGVWEWYQAWTQEASSGPLGPRFAAYGEVRLFGHVFLGDDDYDCGLEMGGCTRRPSCSSIMMQYRDDKELARKVYFVMKLHNTVNLVLKTYYVSSPLYLYFPLVTDYAGHSYVIARKRWKLHRAYHHDMHAEGLGRSNQDMHLHPHQRKKCKRLCHRDRYCLHDEQYGSRLTNRHAARSWQDSRHARPSIYLQ